MPLIESIEVHEVPWTIKQHCIEMIRIYESRMPIVSPVKSNEWSVKWNDWLKSHV